MLEPDVSSSHPVAPDDKVGPVLSDVTMVELDGRLCLYSAQGEQVLVLNETASDILLLADGRLCAEEIIQHLATSYRQPADVLRGQVQAVLNQLRELRVLPPPAG